MHRSKTTSLFDQLVGAAAQGQRHGDAERSGGLEVDVQFDFRCLLDRQIGRLLTLEDTAGIDTNRAIGVGDTATVAYQPTSRDKLARFKNRGHSVLNRQRGKLLDPGIE